MDDFKEQFRELRRQDKGQVEYNIISLEGMPHKLGKTFEGYPVFFVDVENTGYPAKNIMLEILSVRYRVICRLTNNGTTTEQEYTVITLQSADWNLQKIFLDVVMLMLRTFEKPTYKDVAEEVENLITIFSALQKPPVKKIQGLWGEMIVIAKSKHPDEVVNAWHSSPKAKYDFTMGRDKIEVKTTTSDDRVHRFSIDQLNPSPNSNLLIASLIARESGDGNGGMSVRQLYDLIDKRLSMTQQKLKLYKIMASVVGSDFRNLDSVFFDYTESIDSLLFFNAKDVPHINRTDVPMGVTNVKFDSQVSDLDDAFLIESSEKYSQSPLFRNFIP